jgi:hypothetical protein
MKGNGMGAEMTRAEAVKLRVYRVLGHGGITQIAIDIGKQRTYLSDVLNGNVTSAPVLDAIEARLDEIEAEKQAETA